MKPITALAVCAGLIWAGAAKADETRSIIDLDSSSSRVVTGRDFLNLPEGQQIALLWGVTIGHQQGVERMLGMLFYLKEELSAQTLDNLTRNGRTYSRGCGCQEKDGCKAISNRRNIRDLVVDYMNARELRKNQNFERIVDYALTDYCR